MSHDATCLDTCIYEGAHFQHELDNSSKNGYVLSFMTHMLVSGYTSNRKLTVISGFSGIHIVLLHILVYQAASTLCRVEMS